MLPLNADGSAIDLRDYAYNPQPTTGPPSGGSTLLKGSSAQGKTAPSVAHSSDGSTASMLLSGAAPPLHTNLTTYRALRLYRQLACTYTTVYIKEAPSGRVHRLTVEQHYSVYTLWTMFAAHCHTASRSVARMLVLPTIDYLFELSPDISPGDAVNLPKTLGHISLQRYGMNTKDASVVVFCFAQYNPHYAPTLLSTFFDQNSSFRLGKQLTVSSNLDVHLPKSLHEDVVQRTLLEVVERQYALQLRHAAEDRRNAAS